MNYFFNEYSLSYFFFDFVNYFFLVILYFALYEKKIISREIFLFVSIASLSPFFVNNLIIDWWQMPDQLKYFSNTKEIRNVNFLSTKYQIISSSFIFSIFPLPFIETLNSIGFINRGILSLSLIYLLNKKYFNKNFFYFLNLIPSIILYSSLSLRDTLSLVISIFLIFFYLDNQRHLSKIIFFLLLLILIKTLNSIIFFIVAFFYSLFFYRYKKIIFLLKILLLIAIPFVIYYSDAIIEYYNFRRFGMFNEQASNNFTKTLEEIQLNISSLNLLLIGGINFLLSPLPDLSQLKYSFQVLENCILYFFIIYFFYQLYLDNKKKFFFWFFSFLLIIIIYGNLVFNDGTIARYRFVILVIFIIIPYFELNKKKLKKNSYEKKNNFFN